MLGIHLRNALVLLLLQLRFICIISGFIQSFLFRKAKTVVSHSKLIFCFILLFIAAFSFNVQSKHRVPTRLASTTVNYHESTGFVYPLLFVGADSISVHAPWGASPWSEVNKPDVNYREGKHISNLSLSRVTSALLFFGKQKYLCLQLSGQTQREAVCSHLGHAAHVDTASRSPSDRDSGQCVLFLTRSLLGWPVCCATEVSTLVCLGSLPEICTDELMVAEQWCRRCSGGESETARESRKARGGWGGRVAALSCRASTPRFLKPSWG